MPDTLKERRKVNNRTSPMLIGFLLFTVAIACNFPSTAGRPSMSAPEADGAPGAAPPELTQVEPTPVGPVDCGSDMVCFNSEASTCQPTTVFFINPLDIFGLLTTTTSFLEVKGLDGGKCVFCIRTERVEVQYSAELVQQMLDSGLTEEEIGQQKQLAEEQSQEAGYDDICRFNTSDLVAMLTNWQQGNFSADDFDAAECEGKVFSE